MIGLYGGAVPLVWPVKRRGLVRYLSLEEIGDKPAELIPFHDRILHLQIGLSKEWPSCGRAEFTPTAPLRGN
jgi:hypothetical protein